MQAFNGATILLHREQPHAMGSAIVEAHLRLRSADLIGERTAARDDDNPTGAAGDGREPIFEVRRVCKAPAQLDHCGAVTVHRERVPLTSSNVIAVPKCDLR
jgi:hypothetical protein